MGTKTEVENLKAGLRRLREDFDRQAEGVRKTLMAIHGTNQYQGKCLANLEEGSKRSRSQYENPRAAAAQISRLTRRVFELEQRAKPDPMRFGKGNDPDTHPMLKKLEESTGGLWRTAKGELLQVRDMSDGHLENAYQFVVGKREGAESALMLKKEIERRKVDRAWRERDEAKTPSPRAAISIALSILKKNHLGDATRKGIVDYLETLLDEVLPQ